MRSLQASFPVLADASDSVRTTARWALTSLNRRLRQSSDRETSFSFPVETDGEPSWDPAPLANDLPGGLSIPGIACLPPPNDALTRAYSLDKASEVVDIRVVAGEPRRVPSLVTSRFKEMVVALALARNVDAQRVAVRLEVLGQRSVDGLSLEVKVRRAKSFVPCEIHLDVRRDKRGAVRDGVLSAMSIDRPTRSPPEPRRISRCRRARGSIALLSIAPKTFSIARESERSSSLMRCACCEASDVMYATNLEGMNLLLPIWITRTIRVLGMGASASLPHSRVVAVHRLRHRGVRGACHANPPS